MSATTRQRHAPVTTPTHPVLRADPRRLIAYAAWLEADDARGHLTQAEAWALFSGGAPAPTLPALSRMPPPAPEPPLREVPRPAPKPAPQPAPPAPTPSKGREPAPPRAPEPVPERRNPLVSRYERHRLVEVFEFTTEPVEYLVMCTFHRQTRRARTLVEALDLLDDGAWCGICRLIH
jgi:hypothetical protein